MPNEDMNAKDLIRNQNLSETEDKPPHGRTGPGPRASSMRRPGDQRPDPREFMMGEPGEEEMGMPPGASRQSMRPRGPFSPQESSMIKDLLLLAATEAFGNDFDGKIARKMMKGEVPNPGELQHIVDEVRRIPDLPEPHQKLVQKLIDHINTARTSEGGQPHA